MAQLHIEVRSPVMPLSTEFVRFCKTVEQFYYVLVIAADADLERAARAWRGWLSVGFNPAVRLAPPVEADSRIKVDSRPGVGGFEVTVSGRNRAALGRLRNLLNDIDAARSSSNSASDEARCGSLAELQSVRRDLVEPLKESLARCQIPSGAAQALMEMIHRGLLTIAAPDLTALNMTLN